MDNILASIKINSEKEPITVTENDLKELWTKSFNLRTVRSQQINFYITPVINDNTISLKVDADDKIYSISGKEEDLKIHAEKLLNSLADSPNQQSIPYVNTVMEKIKKSILINSLRKDNGLFEDILLTGKGYIKINNVLADVFGAIKVIINDNGVYFQCSNAVRRIHTDSLKNKKLDIYFMPHELKTAISFFGTPEEILPGTSEDNGFSNDNYTYTFQYSLSYLATEADPVFNELIDYEETDKESFTSAAIKALNKASSTKQLRIVSLL